MSPSDRRQATSQRVPQHPECARAPSGRCDIFVLMVCESFEGSDLTGVSRNPTRLKCGTS